MILLVACALLSSATRVGYDTDEDKRAFFRYHHTSTSMTTIATSWTKVAFAVTLLRIVQNRPMTYFLWVIITTANMVLVLGILSIWIPACGDQLTVYRPERNICWPFETLQYLGGTTIGTISSPCAVWHHLNTSSADSIANSMCSIWRRHRHLVGTVPVDRHPKSAITDARKGWPRSRHEPQFPHRNCRDPSSLFPVHRHRQQISYVSSPYPNRCCMSGANWHTT